MRARGAFLALLLAACAPSAIPTPPSPPTEPMPVTGAIDIIATPVPLNARDPKQEKVGNFVYAGGVALSSNQTGRLHGLSDLKITADGRLVAVTDDGDMLTARILLGAQDRLVGLADAVLKPLWGADGQPLQGKENADAEGFAIMPSGEWLVSFERNHRIWRYPAQSDSIAEAPAPRTLFSDNEGMEALAAYPAAAPDAYLVGGEEGEIWLCRLTAACTPAPRQQPPSLDHGLTAIAAFDGPAIGLLYRAYDPVRGARAVVRLVSEPLRHRPAPLVMDTLTLDGPLSRDNFEGLALVRNAQGGARLYLLADDNFSGSQRTLLMAFDWVPPK
ncbi:MAG TPA: esterase-like activity of phytase family protein [Caulobacteraceae bacterium]|nr:esterase-like activity of phytase family protein [Caulobacteraceae bacterium]